MLGAQILMKPEQPFGGIAMTPNGGIEQKGNFGKIVVNGGFDSTDQFSGFNQTDCVVDPVFIDSLLAGAMYGPAKAESEVIPARHASNKCVNLFAMQYRDKFLNVTYCERGTAGLSVHACEFRGLGDTSPKQLAA